MAKEYLGDGVYVETDHHGGIILTTSNGLHDTNTIYLDDSVLPVLKEWLDANA